MPPEIIEPPHTAQKASSLPRWLEWTAAISALVISVCSIGIALYNANIESRMLKANSYPYLIGAFDDAALEGTERIDVQLRNNGVGPADERSLKIKLGDRYVTDMKQLIREAVGPAEADKAAAALVDIHDNEPTRFVASKDSVVVFQIAKTAENSREWELLDRGLSAKGVSIDYCYCSVFDECWKVEARIHTPVKACVRDEAREFRPLSRYTASPLPPA